MARVYFDAGLRSITSQLLKNSEVDRIIDFIDRGEAQGFKDMLALSRYKAKEITLVGRAINLMEKDEEFNKFRQKATDAFRSGQSEYKDLVNFGGERGSLFGLIVPMRSSAQTIRATVNELTWMVRHVNLVATPTGNGSMNIEFLDEKFDVVPSNGRDASYNIVTTILDGLYHKILGNSGPGVNVNWTTSMR